MRKRLDMALLPVILLLVVHGGGICRAAEASTDVAPSEESLQEQLVEMSELLELRDRQIEDLKVAFDGITASFRNRVNELEQKGGAELISAAVEERDKAVARLEQLEAAGQEALAEVEARVAELESERDAWREQVKTLEAEKSEMQGRLDRVEQVEARKDAEIERLQQALVTAKRANEGERFVLAYNLGTLYKAARNYQRAEAEYLKAIALKEHDPALHYNLGILYDDHLGNTAKARYHYERFLQLAPNDRDAPNVVKWLSELE